VLLILFAIFVAPRWYALGAEQSAEPGVDFSCQQAEYLGDNCFAAFRALLQELHVRHVRLSLHWSEVEPRPGTYNFTEADTLIQMASASGADVLLTVGIKAQRYPEFYLPPWLASGNSLPQGAIVDQAPGVRDALLAYVRAAAEHYALTRTVTAWQVENEPFIKNPEEIHGWTVSPQTTADEAAVVRAADPLKRPIVVTHSTWTIYDVAWKQALGIGDVLGENVFTKKAWLTSWWYFFPYEMGPWVPDLPGQAAAARRAGKQFWITEMQAEPEEQRSLLTLDPRQARSISPRLLRDNWDLARRSGATRVYFWGAEWWYHERGTGTRQDLWSTAAAIFAGK